MPNPVTDPALLEQLNGPKAVTNAALLAQLDGKPMGNAVTDIIPEIKKAAGENWQAIKEGFAPEGGKAAQGVLGGQVSTGKGLMGIAGLLASPITGATRSLLGHPMASATHAIGSVIAPEIAAKDDPSQMYEAAKGNVDTAMMALAPRGASPIGVRPGVPAPPPSGAALRADAAETFNNPAIKTTPIPAADVSALSARIENDLVRQGFRPTNGSAPGTLTEVQRMNPGAAGAAANVDDLRAARRALNMTAAQRDPIGRPTPDATAASQAIREIDSFLNNISPALREANANYSAGKLDQTLDYRNMRAEHRAAKTGSGSNIENTMRQEVDKIPDRGLRPQEIEAKNSIVEGTVARNALRKIGKLGFGDGLSMMYHTALALPTAGMNLPVGVAATAARKIGEALTRREISALSAQIRSRAPTAIAQAQLQNPQTTSSAVGTIAALLLGSNKSKIPYVPAVMPSRAEENQ